MVGALNILLLGIFLMVGVKDQSSFSRGQKPGRNWTLNCDEACVELATKGTSGEMMHGEAI